MRSINRVGTQPASLPLSADDIVEFHAARLLLLVLICGSNGRINGLTKMAKLDFFARYPDFFDAARNAIAPALEKPADPRIRPDKRVELAMVRHHYGPWDKRYYHVLAHLEAKRLITITKEGKSYVLALTPLGTERATSLSDRPSFAAIVARMREVKKTFGNKTGSSLKALIYRLFDEEVENVRWEKGSHSEPTPSIRVAPGTSKLSTRQHRVAAFSARSKSHSWPAKYGKTKWLQTLDFLLGDTGENPFQDAEETGLAEKYDAARAYITVAEEPVCVERRWQEPRAKSKVFVNDKEMSARDFQHWLLARLDIPLLHFPKGNPMSGQTWPELSFRILLRHIYRQQRFGVE